MGEKSFEIFLKILITVFITFSIISSGTSQQDVSINGNGYGYGYGYIFVPGEFNKIQWAVDNSSKGDTIFVDSGTYKENVRVDKKLTLIGKDTGGGKPVVNGGGGGNVFALTADKIWIEGFNVVNSGTSKAGIRVTSDQNTIIRNDVNHNYFGIWLSSSGENEIAENRVSDNEFYGIWCSYSSKNSLNRNEVINNDNGIRFSHSSTNNASQNNITSNDQGINLYFSTDNVITNNNLRYNQYGIWSSFSTGNMIYLNNFANWYNAFAYQSMNTWNSTRPLSYIYNSILRSDYLGNYWSDYGGTDPDDNGIGVPPYTINLESDLRPLIRPFPMQMPPRIADLQNSTDTSWINWTWTLDPAYSAEVWINGSLVENRNVAGYYNLTGLPPHAVKEMGVRSVDQYGNKGEFTYQTTTIPNNAPLLQAISSKVVNEGGTVKIKLEGTDIDGDELIYSCNRTDLFDLNQTTGVARWDTQTGDSGIYYVGFGVSDGYGGVDNRTVKITVSNGKEIWPVTFPMFLYGKVINKETSEVAPSGTLVVATANGEEFTSVVDDKGRYGHPVNNRLLIPPCSLFNLTIRLDGMEIHAGSYVWVSGAVERWDLLYSCDEFDGWYCSGNMSEYRDYNVSGGLCTYSVTSSVDCDSQDGWYNYGDLDGCLNTDDPTAENRDYYCYQGSCAYTSVEKDCDHLDGWYGGGNFVEDPPSQYRDFYVTSDGSCVYTVENCGIVDCNYRDGWYGGGNNAGCGEDPSSIKRDYYVIQNTSECAYVEMQSEDCDQADICSPVCDGDVVKSYRDYYISVNSSDCIFVWGSTIEDCTAKESVDPDGMDYTVQGCVEDYTGCAEGECAFNQYCDSCAGDSLTEYVADGSSYSSVIKDCEDYESEYCSGDELYRDEWQCSSGYCQQAPDTLVENCSASDGWYYDTNYREYRDYSCSIDVCVHNVTATENCGDVNCDGSVDILDVYLLLDYLDNPQQYQLCSQWAGDVNCDGSVTITDSRLLLGHVDPDSQYTLQCCTNGIE